MGTKGDPKGEAKGGSKKGDKDAKSGTKAEKGDSLGKKAKSGKGEVQVKKEIQKQERETAPIRPPRFKTEIVTSSSSALVLGHYDSTEASNIPVTAQTVFQNR